MMTAKMLRFARVIVNRFSDFYAVEGSEYLEDRFYDLIYYFIKSHSCVSGFFLLMRYAAARRTKKIHGMSPIGDSHTPSPTDSVSGSVTLLPFLTPPFVAEGM